MSKTGLGPGAPRRGPFSSPNRFQIICFPSFLRHFSRFLSEYNLRKCAASGTEWSEPTREKFGKCLCLFGIFQVPLHIVYFIDFGRNEKTALPHNTDLHVASLCCGGKAVFLFCQKAHSFSIFHGKSAFSFDFSKNRKFSVPYGAKIFSFLVVQNPAPERGANCMPYPGKSQPIPHETPFLKHEFRDRRKWGTPWAAIYGFRAS